MNIIAEQINKIFEKFAEGKYYDQLLDAKEKYFQLTGKLHDDAPDFELRMNSFNDWFLFNYRLEDGRRIIDEYIKLNELDADMAKAFSNVNYSLFYFIKYSWKKNCVVKDVLHSKKLIMEQENGAHSLIPEDLFIGRSVEYKGDTYLLNGICFIPRDVLGLLKKKSRKVRKEYNKHKEIDFLMGLENLKTKSLNYSHIPAEKIFSQI